MSLILEGILVLGMISLNLFSRQGDFNLQCFQVNPETGQESSMGYVTLHRKKNRINAKLIEWGPNKESKASLAYFAIPDYRQFLTVAIFDTPSGIRGHNLVLTRNSTLKGRFHLSEGVADSSNLDYCIKIKKSQLPIR